MKTRAYSFTLVVRVDDPQLLHAAAVENFLVCGGTARQARKHLGSAKRPTIAHCLLQTIPPSCRARGVTITGGYCDVDPFTV